VLGRSQAVALGEFYRVATTAGTGSQVSGHRGSCSSGLCVRVHGSEERAGRYAGGLDLPIQG
jgi:hypothetical protein